MSRPHRVRRGLPWGTVALSGLLCAAAAVLLWRSGPTGDAVGLLAVNTAVAVGYPAVGALILTRHPRHPVGWLLLLAASLAVATVAGGYALYAGGTAAGAGWAAWLSQWTWIPAIVVLPALLLLLFPDGELPSARWRPVLWAVLGFSAALTVWFMVVPGEDANVAGLRNPLGVRGVPEPTGLPLLGAGLGYLLLLGAAVTALLVRFRRSAGVQRAQLTWLLAAGVAFLLGQVSLLVLPEPVATPVEIAAVLVLPAAVAVAIRRYRLYDIDIVVNRSLVYGALTSLVVGGYVAIVTLLGQVFQTRTGLGPALVATALIAVTFQPLRLWLQRQVDRLLYRDRADPYAMLALLGERLQATRIPAEVLPVVTETIAAALRLPYVAVELVSGGRITQSTTHGRPSADQRVLPLTYQSETLGRLVVAPAPGTDFGSAELRLLADVSRQVGIAAWAVRLSADLQRSREQLVSTREEERRRLRRDLHDGLGAALSGIGFSVDAARATLARDPRAAESLLAGVKGQTRDAIGTIRRLVHGLRPPSLDELGLARALQAHVAALGPQPEITLDLHGDLEGLPPAVEVATYWIVVEALTNVTRHAAARHCLVSVRAGGGVAIEVRDDGAGISTDRGPGFGLRSMRERAEEIGGTCVAGPAPDCGTLVQARLPVPAP